MGRGGGGTNPETPQNVFVSLLSGYYIPQDFVVYKDHLVPSITHQSCTIKEVITARVVQKRYTDIILEQNILESVLLKDR